MWSSFSLSNETGLGKPHYHHLVAQYILCLIVFFREAYFSAFSSINGLMPSIRVCLKQDCLMRSYSFSDPQL